MIERNTEDGLEEQGKQGLIKTRLDTVGKYQYTDVVWRVYVGAGLGRARSFTGAVRRRRAVHGLSTDNKWKKFTVKPRRL